MRLHAGKLRHNVTLQSPTRTRDSHGGYTTGWTTVATVRASISPFMGWESEKSAQTTPDKMIQIYIRYGSDWAAIDETWRVVHGTRYYSIAAVMNIDADNQTMRLSCNEGDKDD